MAYGFWNEWDRMGIKGNVLMIWSWIHIVMKFVGACAHQPRFGNRCFITQADWPAASSDCTNRRFLRLPSWPISSEDADSDVLYAALLYRTCHQSSIRPLEFACPAYHADSCGNKPRLFVLGYPILRLDGLSRRLSIYFRILSFFLYRMTWLVRLADRLNDPIGWSSCKITWLVEHDHLMG